jgi:hypothetical protein
MHVSQSHKDAICRSFFSTSEASLSKTPLHGSKQRSQTYFPAKLHPSMVFANGMNARLTFVADFVVLIGILKPRKNVPYGSKYIYTLSTAVSTNVYAGQFGNNGVF